VLSGNGFFIVAPDQGIFHRPPLGAPLYMCVWWCSMCGLGDTGFPVSSTDQFKVDFVADQSGPF